MATFEALSFACRTCADLNIIAAEVQHKVVECRKCTARQIPKKTADFGGREWESTTRPQALIDCLGLLGVERRQRQLRFAHCATFRRLTPGERPLLYSQALKAGEDWAESDIPPSGVRELRYR